MLRLAYFDRDQDSVVMDIGSVLDLKTPWAGKHARWVGQQGLVARDASRVIKRWIWCLMLRVWG